MTRTLGPTKHAVWPFKKKFAYAKQGALQEQVGRSPRNQLVKSRAGEPSWHRLRGSLLGKVLKHGLPEKVNRALNGSGKRQGTDAVPTAQACTGGSGEQGTGEGTGGKESLEAAAFLFPWQTGRPGCPPQAPQ